MGAGHTNDWCIMGLLLNGEGVDINTKEKVRMVENAALATRDIFKVVSEKTVDKKFISNNDKQIQSPSIRRKQGTFILNGLQNMKCDSLFSTCCDKCKRRKVLRDNGILFPMPVFTDKKLFPAEPKDSPICQNRLELRTGSQGFWDMWQGRTIEFDVCKMQQTDENINHVMYNRYNFHSRSHLIP